MRRFVLLLGCVFPLGLCGQAAAVQDPPHTHYASAHVPADLGLKDAKPIGRYRGFLRESVDLSHLMPPVRNQGDLGSGVAWAIAYAARSYYAGRNEGRDIESPENEASPNFVFDVARRGGCDAGATITDTVEVLRKGALSLAAYPYKTACQDPPSSERASATDFRVRGYRVLDAKQADDVKGQLERGNPVVALFRTSQAFEDFRGKDVFSEEDFTTPAGHEDTWQYLAVVGYSDSKQAVRVMNSWGRGWGDDGYAWISYKALAKRTKGAVVLDVAAPGALPPAPPPPPDPEVPKVQPPEPPPPAPPVPPKNEKDAELKQPCDANANPDKPADPSCPAPETTTPTPPQPKVKPTLAEVHNLTCSKLTEAHANGVTTFNGYVASDEDYARVLEFTQDQPKYAVGKIDIAPWPLCEALGTLEKPLEAADIRPTLHTTPNGIATEGDNLRVELQAPAKPSYVYLSYFTADEKVITLVQPEGAILPQTPAKAREIFGDGSEGHGKFTVKAPYGREMVVALTSASPLFDSQLPQIQSEREYLSTLRKALIYKPVHKLADRRVGAAIEVIETREK